MTALVIPSRNPKWPTTIADPDIAAYSQVLQARELEIRVANALVGTGALVQKQTDVNQITDSPNTGEQLDALTATTGFTAGTSCALTAPATNPTAYTGTSLQGAITALVASGVSDTVATWSPTKDLSIYGGGTLLRLWVRISNTSNVKMRLRIEFATSADFAEWDILPTATGAFQEITCPKGAPKTTGGTVDWTNVKKRHVIVTNLNGAGTLTTTWIVRDLRIGLTQNAAGAGHLAYESKYDARVRYRDTAVAKASTTLAANSAAATNNVKLTAVTKLDVGDWLTLETSGYVESRQITIVGTAGAGGTGVTVSEGFTFAHTSADAAKVYYWGPWSDWLTAKFSQKPTAAASSPANAATVTDPTPPLVHTYTSPAGKAQASRTVRVYQRIAGVDQLLYTESIAGTGTSDSVPALLLDTANTYAWEKDVYDTDGLVSTTTRRTFATSFSPPAAVTGATATATNATSSVLVAWAASTNPNLYAYRVYWQDARGDWQRIDGGPSDPDDGLTPLTALSFTHYGARLGLNSYQVTQHTGVASDAAGESAPATVTATLGPVDAVSGQSAIVVPGDTDNTFGVRVYGAPRTWALTNEIMSPPGRGTSVKLMWGRDGRTLAVTVRYRAATDGDLITQLETLAGDPLRGFPVIPFWFKLAARFQIDPIYCQIVALSDAIAAAGWDAVQMTLDEEPQP